VEIVMQISQPEIVGAGPEAGIDFLSGISSCKFCGEFVWPSRTKYRLFCDNNDKCRKAYEYAWDLNARLCVLDRRTSESKLVKDHPAFEIVERPALYQAREFKDGRMMFRQAVSSASRVRIPKFGGDGFIQYEGGAKGTKLPQGKRVAVGLRRTKDKKTKRMVPDTVDVLDRAGVSGDGRYTSPVNSYPPEEKLTRIIFSRRRKKN
jgi:hypothetical protein